MLACKKLKHESHPQETFLKCNVRNSNGIGWIKRVCVELSASGVMEHLLMQGQGSLVRWSLQVIWNLAQVVAHPQPCLTRGHLYTPYGFTPSTAG